MELSYLKIVVASGPDSGKSFEVRTRAIIGRDEQSCDIALTDPSVSRQHAEILFGALPAINALERGRAVYHNGVEVSTADLGDEDSIRVGNTILKVYFIFIKDSDLTEAAKKKTSKVRLIIIILLAVAVGGLGYAYKKQEEERLRTSPLIITGYEELDTVFDDLVKIRVPSFEPEGQGVANQHPFFIRRDEIQTIDAIDSQSRLPSPPDPFGPDFQVDRRGWTALPPRLGNGHLLREEGLVLGDYYAALITYSNREYASIAPSSYPSNGGLSVPLEIKLSVEAYNGLPNDAPMSFVRLSDSSNDPYYEDKPLVPKLFHLKVPSNDEIETSESQFERAYMANRSNGLKVRMEQYRVGEALVILTARYWDFEEERVGASLDALFESQGIVKPERDQPVEFYLDKAARLEEEADGLLGGDPTAFNLKEWELISRDNRRLADVFKAFHRYEEALVSLQVTDRWRYDEDHQRVLRKANRLFDYVQDREGTLQNLRQKIEQVARRTSLLYEVEDEVERLYKITLAAQEPADYALDEWFLYAKLRYMQLKVVR